MELNATVKVKLLMRDGETEEEANDRLADILADTANLADHHIDYWVEESSADDEYVEKKELDCDICGGWLVRKNSAGMLYASGDYIPGRTTCMSCMIEHCCSTDCCACDKSGGYVPCDLLGMKMFYLEEMDREKQNHS